MKFKNLTLVISKHDGLYCQGCKKPIDKCICVKPINS